MLFEYAGTNVFKIWRCETYADMNGDEKMDVARRIFDDRRRNVMDIYKDETGDG